MKIEIFDNVIEFNLLNEIKTFKKYETNKSPNYIVNEYLESFEIPNGNPIKTEFYDLYDNIQIQKINGKIVSKIEYLNNIINIYSLYKSEAIDYIVSQYAASYAALRCNKLFMHGSSILYKGLGIAFLAKSGTGKSTHVNKWLRLSDSKIINDDKQIISIENDKIMLNPNPWSGKHYLDNCIKAPLGCLVFIKRSNINKARIPSEKEKFLLIIKQLGLIKRDNLELWDNIVDKLLEIPSYILECNMDDEAFYVLNKRIEDDLIEGNR